MSASGPRHHTPRAGRRGGPWLALALALCLLVLAPVLLPAPAQASLLHLEGPEPQQLGPRQGHLRPCASPAHCACSDWPVADPQQALERLQELLAGDSSITVEEIQGPYLHATARSRLFGFVDDLELLADPSGGVLEARSESRLGDSDLGVNGRRLQDLRDRLAAAGA